MSTLAKQIAMLQEAHEKAIAAVYSNTTMPVREILDKYDISYNKLYHILRRRGVPLRNPHSAKIVILDDEQGGAPTLVDRNPSTLDLRRKQIQDAYYTRGEVVSHICTMFRISYRTLYSICSANRRGW